MSEAYGKIYHNTGRCECVLQYEPARPNNTFSDQLQLPDKRIMKASDKISPFDDV